jgi:hypothetical protein
VFVHLLANEVLFQTPLALTPATLVGYLEKPTRAVVPRDLLATRFAISLTFTSLSL